MQSVLIIILNIIIPAYSSTNEPGIESWLCPWIPVPFKCQDKWSQGAVGDPLSSYGLFLKSKSLALSDADEFSHGTWGLIVLPRDVQGMQAMTKLAQWLCRWDPGGQRISMESLGSQSSKMPPTCEKMGNELTHPQLSPGYTWVISDLSWCLKHVWAWHSDILRNSSKRDERKGQQKETEVKEK